jgi:AcrR family transcriptional regulator
VEKKEDRRAVRSKDAMLEACLSLMEEIGFERVTVQLVVERANVNRSTFYAHYLDKYDLADRLVEGTLERLVAAIRPALLHEGSLTYSEEEPHPALTRLFEFVADEARFFRLMFGEKGAPGFKAKLQRVVREQLYGAMLSAYYEPARAKVSPDVMVDYVLSAHMGVITAWLFDGMRLPPGDIARQLNVICYVGPFRAGGVLP